MKFNGSIIGKSSTSKVCLFVGIALCFAGGSLAAVVIGLILLVVSFFV